MKKKLLALAIVLAMVAAFVVPMTVSAAGPSIPFWYCVNGTINGVSGGDNNLWVSSNPLITTEGNSASGVLPSIALASDGYDAGIVLYPDGSMTLAGLASQNLDIYTTGSQVNVNLWLDANNNGQFFAWNADGMMVPGSRNAAGTDFSDSDFVDSSAGQPIMLNDSSVSAEGSGSGVAFGGMTLAELASTPSTVVNQDGNSYTVTPSTKVALWVGAEGTSEITNITINGAGATLVPVSYSSSNGSSVIAGTLAGPTASITAPSNIAFGTFAPGWNVETATPGEVTVGGSAGAANWSVTAENTSNQPYLMNGANTLTDYLLLGSSTSGPWFIANGGTGTYGDTGLTGNTEHTGTLTGALTYNNVGGASASLPFAAAQFITPNDANNPAGSYTNAITFTVSITP
jgi:hypothetical protein